MKEVVKALVIVAALVSICASVLTLMNQLGLLRRNYLTVEES
jgi:hypothetical protein